MGDVVSLIKKREQVEEENLQFAVEECLDYIAETILTDPPQKAFYNIMVLADTVLQGRRVEELIEEGRKYLKEEE